MKFLITGANGQLGTEFQRVLTERTVPFLAPPEHELDIADAAVVDQCLMGFQPDVVLNCAAYNNVDEAERNPQDAMSVNRDAVRLLARVCERNGCRLVHYSSDYVFDGEADVPYTERDKPRPINAYGASKLCGEEAILDHGDDVLVLRLSWVFGPGRQNFLRKLWHWSEGKREQKVVSDQTSIPTYTGDIVDLTLQAVNRGLRGLYHLTNSGYSSRDEVARYFFSLIDREITVTPVDSSHFPSLASRPRFSAMDNNRLAHELQVGIPDWKSGVRRFLARDGVEL